MDILQQAMAQQAYVVGLRRHFHENPELSEAEFATMERICRELEEMGIPYTLVEKGGILAKLQGDRPGKTVLLRADIDALPVTETRDNLIPGGRTCLSKVPGVMHACGHDAHTAMLLGAAKILLSHRQDLAGTVYLCFEQGEEKSVYIHNLLAYIEENLTVDTVFGIHVYADLPAGCLAINDRQMMAGNMKFTVELEGKGGHGSRPDQANNPIDCFVAIYQRLQALRVARFDPFQSCTYSVGHLEAGKQNNVIPQNLLFEGTMRSFAPEKMRMEQTEEFTRAIESLAAAYGCSARIGWRPGGVPTLNDPELAAFARQVIGEAIGKEKVVTCEPWMASESFSRYLMRWKGVFAFLGIKNPEKGSGALHHHPAFDIDEAVLPLGAAAAATYALEYLKN